MDKSGKRQKRLRSQLTDRFIDYIRETGDMMIQLELHFQNRVDADRLERALNLTLDIVPVLGCRFVRRTWRPYWEKLSQNPKTPFQATEDIRDYESFKSSPIDGYSGPQATMCLCTTSNGTKVLLKVSHLAADAAGVKETMRIISSTYSRLKDAPDYKPDSDMNGSRNVRQVIDAVPLRRYPRLFSNFMNDNKANRNPQDILTIPTSGKRSKLPNFVRHIISRDHTTAIIDYAHEHGATVNDMLLTAFFRALASTQNWEGMKQLKATTTVDLRQHITREKISSVANLSIPIWGWPNLDTDLGKDFLSTLNMISKITRERKQNYLGIETLIAILFVLGPMPHSLSARLVGQGIQDKLREGNFASAFTNMGIIDPETVILDEKPVEACLLPPPVYPPWLMLGISSYEGVISLSAGVYSTQKMYVKRFFKAMDAELPQ